MNMIANVKLLIELQGRRSDAERRNHNALEETRNQGKPGFNVLPTLVKRNYAFECTDRRNIERRARLLQI